MSLNDSDYINMSELESNSGQPLKKDSSMHERFDGDDGGASMTAYRDNENENFIAHDYNSNYKNNNKNNNNKTNHQTHLKISNYSHNNNNNNNNNNVSLTRKRSTSGHDASKNIRSTDPKEPDSFALSTTIPQNQFEQSLEWAKNSFLYEILAHISRIILWLMYHTLQIGIGRVGIAGILQCCTICICCDFIIDLSYFLESFCPLILTLTMSSIIYYHSAIKKDNENDILNLDLHWVVLVVVPILVFSVTIIFARYYVKIIHIIDKICCCKCCCFMKQNNKKYEKYYEKWQRLLNNKDGYQMLLFLWGIDVKYVPSNLYDEILILGAVMPAMLCGYLVEWIYFDQYDFQCYKVEKDSSNCKSIADMNGNYMGCCEIIDETTSPTYILTILVVNIVFFYQLTMYVLISMLAHLAKDETDRILDRPKSHSVIKLNIPNNNNKNKNKKNKNNNHPLTNNNNSNNNNDVAASLSQLHNATNVT